MVKCYVPLDSNVRSLVVLGSQHENCTRNTGTVVPEPTIKICTRNTSESKKLDRAYNILEMKSKVSNLKHKGLKFLLKI